MIEVHDSRRLPFIWINLELDDAGLNPYECRMYLHIVRRAGHDGACYETVANMAAHCNMSTGSAKRALRGLIDKGLLSRDSRRGTTSVYKVTNINLWATEGGSQNVATPEEPTENDMFDSPGQNVATPLPGQNRSTGGSEGSGGGSHGSGDGSERSTGGQNGSGGGSETTHKEDPLKKDPLKKIPLTRSPQDDPLMPVRREERFDDQIFSQAESNRPNPQDSPSGPSEPDSNPQSYYPTVTVEPIAAHQLLVTGSDSGEDTSFAPAKKTRKKKKSCDVRHARGSNSAYYPTEALDLFELWKPMYSALRGGSDSRAGFIQGFDALIEQDIPVEDIIEGTCFYIHDKMQRLGRGKNPTVPPDAIRFFKGSRDHPSSYCLDALEHKHAQESRTLTPQQQAVMAIATETPPKILELQRKELERRRRIEERERESREQNRLFWTNPPQH